MLQAVAMFVPRQAGLRRARGAIALARARLRAAGGVRIARGLTALATLGVASIVLVLRLLDGAGAPLGGLVSMSARGLVWLTAVPIALAAAGNHRTRDRREGIALLAAVRGVSHDALDAARTLAAMAEITWTLGVPLVFLALLTAALAEHPLVALARAGLGVKAAGFALVTGVTLGGLAAACGRIGGPRGRWWLVGLVVVPWLLGDLTGQRAWSLPGALGAVFEALLQGKP